MFQNLKGIQFAENGCICCRKTAVCIGDQLLDFSVQELVRSQSTFSTDSEVLQICSGFTLCSSASLVVGEWSVVMGLTPTVLCGQIYCVLCVLDCCLLYVCVVNTSTMEILKFLSDMVAALF